MNRCIYCKRNDGTFLSVEHIFPESMGNKELILPKGVVCDTCNNGVLSELDQTLLDFEPVAFLRPFFNIESKSGALPKASFGNLKIVRESNNQVNIFATSGSKKLVEHRLDGLNLNLIGKKRYTSKHCRKLARAFYKIGLGLVYLDHGLQLALSERYDDVRSIILGEHPNFSGYLVFSRKVGKPEPKATVMYRLVPFKGQSVTLFKANLFGFIVLFDLEHRDLGVPNPLKETGLFNVIEF